LYLTRDVIEDPNETKVTCVVAALGVGVGDGAGAGPGASGDELTAAELAYPVAAHRSSLSTSRQLLHAPLLGSERDDICGCKPRLDFC
jgi:hypothetical protein